LALRTKVFILVVLVGVLTLGISFVRGEIPNTTALFSAGLIAGVINVLLVAFNHYGWRIPGLRFVATSPNIRGTWIFRDPRVIQLAGEPSIREDLPGGFLVIRQSDTHIRVTMLWDGAGPSELRQDSPVSVNADKCCFTGTYVEKPAGTEHSFGAFFTFSSKSPTDFVLRYRTDNDITGEIQASDPKPWMANAISDAKSRADKKVKPWDTILFALRWT